MDSGQKGQNQSNKTVVFLKRLASTVILWAIILAALFAPWRAVSLTAFFLIVMVLTISGMLEFYRFLERKNFPVPRFSGILTGTIYSGFIFGMCVNGGVLRVSVEHSLPVVLSLIVIVVFSLRLISPVNSEGFKSLGSLFLGFLYVPFLLGFVQIIYFSYGTHTLFLFILLTKFSDSGAYIFGSLFGKHKMAPTISPGKTWEGFAGAVLIPVAAGFLVKMVFKQQLCDFSNIEIIVLGAILGIAAVIGDLIESVFKRECGVKDSGNYFPGVGGVLDVLDSILFNAPIMYSYLYCKTYF